MTDASKNIADLKMFFILGRPRSGTTLLTSLLDAHPNIVIPFECPVILSLYPAYGNTHYWNERKINSFFNDLQKLKKFNHWKIDLKKVKKDIFQFKGKLTFKEIIKILYRNYQSLFEKNEIRLTGDKNPMYSLYPGKIMKIFPDALYIHLIRDFRDQVSSMLTMNFELPNTALQAFRWKYSYMAIDRLKKADPDKFITVRYEDLVDDPRGKIKELCNFLGIEYIESMLDFHQVKEKAYSNYSESVFRQYHSKLFQPVTPEYMGEWKQRLKPSQVKIAGFIAGKTAAGAGYEFKALKTGFPVLVQYLPGLIYSYTWLLAKTAIEYSPAFIRRLVGKTANVLPFIYHRLFIKKRGN